MSGLLIIWLMGTAVVQFACIVLLARWLRRERREHAGDLRGYGALVDRHEALMVAHLEATQAQALD